MRLSTRVDPDCIGRCTCSHTASTSAIAAITRSREVVRVRAREAQPSNAVDAADRAKQIGEIELAVVIRVHRLAEQHDFGHSLGDDRLRPRARRRPSAGSAPDRASSARCSTCSDSRSRAARESTPSPCRSGAAGSPRSAPRGRTSWRSSARRGARRRSAPAARDSRRARSRGSRASPS